MSDFIQTFTTFKLYLSLVNDSSLAIIANARSLVKCFFKKITGDGFLHPLRQLYQLFKKYANLLNMVAVSALDGVTLGPIIYS